MNSPAFWWRPPGLLARSLVPAALVYGAAARRRLGRPALSAPCPVVCIGNVTVGGSGKTPTALAIGAMVAGFGGRPGFLTRGYGGRLSGPVMIDPAHHDAVAVGDEALLLARDAPTVVARNRPAGAALLAAHGVNLIVMDDGLQNPSLAKTLSIATFDGAVGLGNGWPLPAGPLRAPMNAQWPLIDFVLVIGAGAAGDEVEHEAESRGLPTLRARLDARPDAARRLAGARILAFAGIGRPGKFFETVAACGADLVATRAFPDHHVFTPGEIDRLSTDAANRGLRLVTTEKDFVRLGRGAAGTAIETLPVDLVFEDDQRVRDLIAPVCNFG